MKNNTILTAIVALLIGLGGGFFAGMQYQKNQPQTFMGQFNNGTQESFRNGQNAAQRRIGNGMGGRQQIGEIINKDDKSVTIKLQDGSSKIILLTNSTSIIQATQASKDELKVGERIGVFGTQNNDGSVTAQNIQLNPMFRGVTSGAPRQ